MSWLSFLKKEKFNIMCILFELQKPGFMWDSELLCPIIYHFHEFVCFDMIFIRFMGMKYFDR